MRFVSPAPTALAAAFAVAGMLGGASAQTPAPRPAAPPAQPTAPAQPADPALEAATKLFDALPEADRRGIQESLVWTGDFNGVVSGGFGKRTYDAIRAYQRREKLEVTGMLDDKGRAGLADRAKKAREAVKFSVLKDDKTGIQIGVPLGLADKRVATATGTRFRAEGDPFVIETSAIPESTNTLEELYEKLTAPQTDRKVVYKFQRPDFFVLSGEEKGRRFYTRWAKGGSGLRGFTLSYPVARARELDRISIAVANAFQPFTTGDVATARPPGAPGATPPRPGEPPKTGPKTVLEGMGLVIAPGRVLTASRVVDDCPMPLVGGMPAPAVKTDKALGLALLGGQGVKGKPWTGAPGAALGIGDAVIGVVLSDSGAGPRETGVVVGSALTQGEGARWRAQLALQGGGAGAPLFDRRGALVGLVIEGRKVPYRVAGVVPLATYLAVDGATLRLFATDNKVELTQAPAAGIEGAGAVAGLAGPSVVAIECVK